MDTGTETASNPQMELARQMATAIFTKLQLQGKYMVSVRRHAEPVAMPWIELAWCQNGKDPTTHEFCISLPEAHYMVETREEKSALATYLFKLVATMVGKLAPK